jgi:hypothetical protein
MENLDVTTPPPPPAKKKTGAIIGTIVAVLLCGCPGLTLCVLSAGSAFGMLPASWTGGSVPAWYGYAGLCVSVILVLIPIVVALVTLPNRKPKAPKPPKNSAAQPPQEPLPPAS